MLLLIMGCPLDISDAANAKITSPRLPEWMFDN